MIAGAREREGAKKYLQVGRRFSNVPGVHPDAFNADLPTAKDSLVHVTGTPISERCGINFQELRWKNVRRREHFSISAYEPEFAKALQGGWAGRIEEIKDLR